MSVKVMSFPNWWEGAIPVTLLWVTSDPPINWWERVLFLWHFCESLVTLPLRGDFQIAFLQLVFGLS